MYTSVAFKQKKISLLALFLVPKQLLQSFSPTTVEVPPPPLYFLETYLLFSQYIVPDFIYINIYVCQDLRF